MDLQEIGFGGWTRFIWLRTRTEQVSGYLEYIVCVWKNREIL